MTTKLIAALVAARKEIGGAKKGNVNPHFKSKYADLASVIEAVKEPLERHGLTFVQDISEGCVATVLMHESGETLRLAPFPLVATQNTPQATGSALTYARRYSLQTALGVPAEDDDGNEASKPRAPVIAPVKTAGVDPALSEKADSIASALVDLHSAAEQGDDKAEYSAHETVDNLDTEMKLAVWNALQAHSKVRSWLKKISQEKKAA